jgi:hypothetical protein
MATASACETANDSLVHGPEAPEKVLGTPIIGWFFEIKAPLTRNLTVV